MFRSLLVAAAILTPLIGAPLGAVPSNDPSVLGDTPTVAPRVIDPAKIGPMTFDDDFKTFDHGVDQERPAKPHKWRTVYGINGPNDPANRMLVNNLEDQVFVDPAFGGLTGCPALGIDPFDFKPGQVDVKAERLSGVAKKCLGYGWSSGLLTTMFSFSQKWGYFEAELDVPTAKGFWPAFWLVPTEGPWPDGGEIDVLESVGPATPGGQAKASINTVWKSPEDSTSTASSCARAPPRRDTPRRCT